MAGSSTKRKLSEIAISGLSLLGILTAASCYGSRSAPDVEVTLSEPSLSTAAVLDGEEEGLLGFPDSLPPLPPQTNIRPLLPPGDHWGVGYLVESRGQVSDRRHTYPVYNPSYDWLRRLRLALYDAPMGELRGWLASGWIVDVTGDPGYISLLQPDLVQTSYETYSFIVLADFSC